MNERDSALLFEMLGYCEAIPARIGEFSIDEDSFVGNAALADMLLMPVFQIGELAHGLSDEFCTSHDGIPWHAIKAFRNIIAHDYGVVDPLWAWNTIQIDIPVLESFLREMMDR